MTGPILHSFKESVRVIPSRRGEGGVARCQAACLRADKHRQAGSKRPEAYSLEYGEDCFGPRTTQMAMDHSPQ